MAAPKRLALFVEGPADAGAVPTLVRRLLTEMAAWDAVRLDNQLPFMVGNVDTLTRADSVDWVRYLQRARSPSELGAVLLLLDGDSERVRGEAFCPCLFARRLAERARVAGAGQIFSVAVVFACQEYESWLVACADQLGGQPLPDGRPGIVIGATPPVSPELAPRDAKRWLDANMKGGYKNTDDQLPLTQLLVQHLDAVRARNLRSFRRLENALRQLVESVRSGNHIASP